SFIDIQSLITYQLSQKLELSFLGNFAQNQYLFIPKTRSTNFGTINEVFNLTVYYDGQELDRYRSALGAFTLNFKPKDNLSLKLIGSGSSSYEQEAFDIEGYYLINELDNTVGSSTYGDSLLNIGVGGQLDHARNFLWVDSWTVSHIGVNVNGQHTFRWALDFKTESIIDRMKEWTFIDSAGYSSPYSPTSIVLNDLAEARHNLRFDRISGYFQDTYQFSSDKTRFYLNGGVRFNYWSYNKEFLISPRIRFSIKPDWKRDFMFFIASGVYYQPPSYKEMRDFQGNLNPNIKAQRSIHIVAGSDYNLLIWNRPFKLTSEVYYKFLNDLIPYKIDNVRIRYIAKNNAVGYASGLDLKLNGEFVPGIESWASLSLLKTEENQSDDYYYDSQGNKIYPGYYPRPTDQRVMFSLFFQDYLPNNPTLQVHLNLAYGSALPVSPLRSYRFDETFPMGPYRRVDLGFSKTLKERNKTSDLKFLNRLSEMILSLEVFNLLNISNKASYLWVKTVNNQENVPNEFAVPNYLTSRRINLKLSVKF
ncbi:MAG TPA: TonB-dependent receptor, partial [Bacteroidales bacterium]